MSFKSIKNTQIIMAIKLKGAYIYIYIYSVFILLKTLMGRFDNKNEIKLEKSNKINYKCLSILGDIWLSLQ